MKRDSFAFHNTEQAVRFAFTLDHQPGDAGNGALARIAMSDAGIRLHARQVGGFHPAQLREQAQALMLVISGKLRPAEGAALAATYARTFDVKRDALILLCAHFGRELAGLIDHRPLADKLVERHYLTGTARRGGWSLADIGARFGVAKARLVQAVALIEEHAAQLEAQALAHLQQLVQPQTHDREVSHA
jgi:hypothetical protein